MSCLHTSSKLYCSSNDLEGITPNESFTGIKYFNTILQSGKNYHHVSKRSLEGDHRLILTFIPTKIMYTGCLFLTAINSLDQHRLYWRLMLMSLRFQNALSNFCQWIIQSISHLILFLFEGSQCTSAYMSFWSACTQDGNHQKNCIPSNMKCLTTAVAEFTQMDATF